MNRTDAVPDESKPQPETQDQPKSSGTQRFDSLNALINHEWSKQDISPRFAWVRYSLSAGLPTSEFSRKLKELASIRHAFGRRVLVLAVRMDPHEVGDPSYRFEVNPTTGQLQVEIDWRMTRIQGGPHILFAVEASPEEANRNQPAGLDALDALEALIRLALGAMVVVKTRRTTFLNLEAGTDSESSPPLQVYGPAEQPRTDANFLSAATQLAERSATLPLATRGRLSLGLRWTNIAFKAHDLLAFWTAIEILADRRGHGVYPVVAMAYGHQPRSAQSFARVLGLDVICNLRGELAHKGRPIYVSVEGASYLNALAHDLARHVAGLTCLRLAESMLKGRKIEDLITRST